MGTWKARQVMASSSHVILRPSFIEKKERRLWCCNPREMWRCFILWVGLNPSCNPETGIARIRGAPMTTPSFWRRTPWTCANKLVGISLHPNGKPLDLHMVGWRYSVQLDTLTVIGWIIGGRVHQEWSARKVTHLSTIPALGGLTLKFSWDPCWGPGFKPSSIFYHDNVWLNGPFPYGLDPWWLQTSHIFSNSVNTLKLALRVSPIWETSTYIVNEWPSLEHAFEGSNHPMFTYVCN